MLRQIDQYPAKLSYLRDLKYTGLSGDTMQLTLLTRARIGFIRGKLDDLSNWLSDMAQSRVRVQLIEPDDLAEAPSTQPQRGLSQQDKVKAMSMPLTRQAAELFDATLIDLRDEQTDTPSPQ